MQTKIRRVSSRPFVGALLAASLALRSAAADNKAEAEPRVIEPGPPPSDAIVLFDGKDLSQWQSVNGAEARWKIEDGVMMVNGTGNIITKEEFADVQVHVEWATPKEVKGHGQERGNSGVYLQGRYEIQVLDSYDNKTYANGQAGAFYGVSAPLVNASRKPSEWQTYDIPVKGEATTAAHFTGVASKGPLMLQDHNNPVRYRNLWIRPL